MINEKAIPYRMAFFISLRPDQMLEKPDFISQFQLHLSVLLFGFTGIFGELISLAEIPLVWWRMVIALAILLVVLFTRKGFQIPNRKTVGQLVYIGMVMAIHWVAFFGSIKYSNVSIAVSCFASTAMFTTILNTLMEGGKFRLQEMLLSILTIAGISMIFGFQEVSLLGMVLGIISAVLAAYFSILNKRLVSNVEPLNMLFFQLVGGLAILTLIGPFLLKILPAEVLIPGGYDWIWLLILSGVCTVVAIRLAFLALRKISAFTQNLALNLEPIYAIIIAGFLFNEYEQMTWMAYCGALLIIAAVVLDGFLRYRKA